MGAFRLMCRVGVRGLGALAEERVCVWGGTVGWALGGGWLGLGWVEVDGFLRRSPGPGPVL